MNGIMKTVQVKENIGSCGFLLFSELYLSLFWEKVDFG